MSHLFDQVLAELNQWWDTSEQQLMADLMQAPFPVIRKRRGKVSNTNQPSLEKRTFEHLKKENQQQEYVYTARDCQRMSMNVVDTFNTVTS